MMVRVRENLRGVRVETAQKAAPKEANAYEVPQKKVRGAEAKRGVRKLRDQTSQVIAN